MKIKWYKHDLALRYKQEIISIKELQRGDEVCKKNGSAYSLPVDIHHTGVCRKGVI